MEQLLVCGGGSKIDGISQKLIREFNDTMAPSTAGALIHPADYLPESVAEFSAWVGGGVLVKVIFYNLATLSRNLWSQPACFMSSKAYSQQEQNKASHCQDAPILKCNPPGYSITAMIKRSNKAVKNKDQRHHAKDIHVICFVQAVALPQQYMSKMEYNEAGPNAIHKHCI